MSRKYSVGLCVAIALAFGFGMGVEVSRRASAEDTKPAKAYELRTYVAAPGKLADLNKRFRDHTTALFTKHGMTAIGYWTPFEGPDAENTLVYILAHESREAAKKSWMAFGTDPEWIKAKKESEVNGSLTTKVESKFLKATDYSPLQ